MAGLELPLAGFRRGALLGGFQVGCSRGLPPRAGAGRRGLPLRMTLLTGLHPGGEEPQACHYQLLHCRESSRTHALGLGEGEAAVPGVGSRRRTAGLYRPGPVLKSYMLTSSNLDRHYVPSFTGKETRARGPRSVCPQSLFFWPLFITPATVLSSKLFIQV